MYRVRSVMGEWMVVLPREKMMEIKNCSNNTLSWKETIPNIMLLRYTGGPDRAAWSARALRVEITKRLGNELDAHMREGVQGFSEESFVQTDEQWHDVQIHDLMVNCVARITNRSFAGPELASDREWVEATKRFTETAWAAAADVKVLHPLLRWPATFFMPSVEQLARDMKYTKECIRPLFEERLRGMQTLDWKRPEEGLQ